MFVVWRPRPRAGIPSTVVIAASFDDVIAITGYSIFSSVAITGQGDVAWQIASGPLQVGRGDACVALPAKVGGKKCAAGRTAGPRCPHIIEEHADLHKDELASLRCSNCPPTDLLCVSRPPARQVVFGILGGLIAGLILGCTRLFCTRNKRLVRGAAAQGPPSMLLLWKHGQCHPYNSGCHSPLLSCAVCRSTAGAGGHLRLSPAPHVLPGVLQPALRCLGDCKDAMPCHVASCLHQLGRCALML